MTPCLPPAKASALGKFGKLSAAAAREVGTSDQLELFRVFKEHDWHHVLTMAACLELLGNFALGGAIILPVRSCISGRELFFMDSLSFRDPFWQCSRSSSRRWGGGDSCRRWHSADSKGLRRDPGFQLPRRLRRALDFVVCTPCDGSAMPCSFLSRRKI